MNTLLYNKLHIATVFTQNNFGNSVDKNYKTLWIHYLFNTNILLLNKYITFKKESAHVYASILFNNFFIINNNELQKNLNDYIIKFPECKNLPFILDTYLNE